MAESDKGSSEGRGPVRAPDCRSGLRFVVDNNLSPHLARGMSAFGENVAHVLDELGPGIEDTVLLEYASQKDYFLITQDKRMRRNPAEVAAIRRCRVGAFVLTGKAMNRCEQIQQIVKLSPAIKTTAQKENRPFIFTMPRHGGEKGFRRIL